MSQTTRARGLSLSVSTVRRWSKKAARAATTFKDLHPSPVELQADD